MSALFQAILEAQKEIKNAVKDSKNPHFKNDYASLEAVIDATVPIYNKHGIVVIQQCGDAVSGSISVMTRLVHAETGDAIADCMVIPLAKNDPQGVGSAITYGRRYGLQAMSCTASEDDDGERAVVTPAKKPDPGNQPADPAEVKAIQERVTRSLGSLGFKKT